MSKTGRKKMNKKLVIALILIFFTLICMAGTLFFVFKKEDEVKEPLAYVDFESGLAQEYQLLNCNINKDSIEFHVSGIKDNYYSAICKNIENMMKIYSQAKENANQKDFKIFVYKNNTKNYTNEKPEAVIDYHLYDTTCLIEKTEKMPSADNTDGLLPYEFLEFDGKTLTVSMDLSEYSLVERGKQMKVLYQLAKKLNYLDELTLKVQDKDVTYVYNDSNDITIIEKREINF